MPHFVRNTLGVSSLRGVPHVGVRTTEDLFRRVERAKQEWEITADAIPDLICLVDSNGNIVRVNRTVETWNLAPVTHAPGQPLHSLVHPRCEAPHCYLNLLLKRLPDVIFRGESPRMEVYDPHLHKYIQASVHPLPPGAKEKNVHAATAVILLRDVTERKVAEKSLRSYMSRLEVLNDLGRAILAAQSSESIAREAVQRLRRIVQCERASLILFDEDTATYRVVAEDTAEDGLQGKESGSAVVDYFVRQVPAHTVVIGDLTSLPERFAAEQALIRAGIRAVVIVPLQVDGRVIGSLNLGSRQPHRFGDEEVRVAEEVAYLVAIAVQQAQLMKKLRDTNQALQVALKSKEEMILYVSHELRTPLTVVEGYLSLLREEVLGPLVPEQHEALESMTVQTQRLLNQINRLLALQRVDAEPFQQDVVDVGMLVQWLKRTWQVHAQKAGIALHVQVDAPSLMVMGDVDMLQQMLNELVDNALKFSPRGSHVWVRAWQEGEEARVSIQDEGTGIPAEILPHLFQHFLQVNGGLNRPVGGMGIGLALCRKVVEAHGGRIWAESKGEGQGATFHVALPLYQGK